MVAVIASVVGRRTRAGGRSAAAAAPVAAVEGRAGIGACAAAAAGKRPIPAPEGASALEGGAAALEGGAAGAERMPGVGAARVPVRAAAERAPAQRRLGSVECPPAVVEDVSPRRHGGPVG